MAKEVKPSLAIYGEIEAETTLKVLSFLKANRRKNVLIYINSEGGSVHQALQIYKFIKDHKRVITIAIGECSSAATIILAAGSKRLATKETEFLIHYGEETNNSIQERKRHDQLLEEMSNIYKELGIGDEALDQFYSKEAPLNFDEAKLINLVTGEFKL